MQREFLCLAFNQLADLIYNSFICMLSTWFIFFGTQIFSYTCDGNQPSLSHLGMCPKHNGPDAWKLNIFKTLIFGSGKYFSSACIRFIIINEGGEDSQ